MISNSSPPPVSVPPPVPLYTSSLPATTILRLSQLPFARRQRMEDGEAVLPQALDHTEELGPWFGLPVQVPTPLKERTYTGQQVYTAPGAEGTALPHRYQTGTYGEAPYGHGYRQTSRPGGLGRISEYELARREELARYEAQQRARLYGTSSSYTMPAAQAAVQPKIDESMLKAARAALHHIQKFEARFVDSMNDIVREDYFALIDQLKRLARLTAKAQYALMKRYRGFEKEKLYWLDWETYNDYALLQRFRTQHP